MSVEGLRVLPALASWAMNGEADCGPDRAGEPRVTLTGGVAGGYLGQLMWAANAGVGFNAARLNSDAILAQRGDLLARRRLFARSVRPLRRPPALRARAPRRARRPAVRRVAGIRRARAPSRKARGDTAGLPRGRVGDRERSSFACGRSACRSTVAQLGRSAHGVCGSILGVPARDRSPPVSPSAGSSRCVHTRKKGDRDGRSTCESGSCRGGSA